ncbi:BTB/POZ domain-containing protein KCTD9-like protein [Dinothrombium tinctorium]|uniref:BTB/POZ domain-containing protein KCTD9-like protein n=1 Tax=Dinothrombium tinctorium TaxID=1965070 RepID=A0A3S3NVW8_9ACAR|nr:BTB/POZ domain-containing protein KCTD9-like protein [Dinothrombium tinctorium]RWS02876.1 BTB/POZ domain-containing protein KCTD9-like protein [Dinothrombium tinctorium]
MRRVIIFRNGSAVDGKVVLVTNSLQELLRISSQKLQLKAKLLFTPQGGEIDDIALIRDDDILYVSEGEPFKAPLDINFRQRSFASHSDWILLNIGGRLFSTTKSTIITKEPDSMIARMFSSEPLMCPSPQDANGAYLIDRSPTYFEPILGYLRHGELILDKNVNPQGVLEEAKFYGILSLIPILESIIASEESPPTDPNCIPLTRQDVIKALISTTSSSELRFQGVNLMGADLSRLDLRNINFKYANLQGACLRGANLSYSCLERADLSGANMEGAVLHSVKMVCANLEGAVLKGANMEDPLGNRTNMEGVNLKAANLEGSQMAGVNLRVAKLKNANLQNCDLRGTILAGADLENCDLSGSDLHEANLRGANLKGASFELMLTPLHMAQAIR